MAGIAMLTAVSVILQYLDFPLPMLIPPFIKFDFSDLPALIGAYAYGPLAGVIIELIKNLIHCAITKSATVGELSNFLLGAAFAGTAGFIYKINKTKKTAIIGGIIRGSEAFIAVGDTQVEAYDRVAIFALPDTLKEIDRFFK